MENIFKINNKMHHLLIELNIDSFTVHQLRVHYHQCGFSSEDNKRDRQFLYRQLFMLEAKGLLEKRGANHSRSITYHKSSLFKASTITPNKSSKLEKASRDKRSLPKLEDLKSSLQQYQMKFVSSLSESEEYLKVIEQFPKMSAQIKPSYYQTRENSTRYLGKINALKRIIEAYPE